MAREILTDKQQKELEELQKAAVQGPGADLALIPASRYNATGEGVPFDLGDGEHKLEVTYEVERAWTTDAGGPQLVAHLQTRGDVTELWKTVASYDPVTEPIQKALTKTLDVKRYVRAIYDISGAGTTFQVSLKGKVLGQ